MGGSAPDYGEYFWTWPGWDGSGAATSADGDFLVLPRTAAVLVAYLYVTSYFQQTGPYGADSCMGRVRLEKTPVWARRGLFGSNGAQVLALCRTMVHETGRDRVGAGASTGGGGDGAQDWRR